MHLLEETASNRACEGMRIANSQYVARLVMLISRETGGVLDLEVLVKRVQAGR